jgi:hypothetical protein
MNNPVDYDLTKGPPGVGTPVPMNQQYGGLLGMLFDPAQHSQLQYPGMARQNYPSYLSMLFDPNMWGSLNIPGIQQAASSLGPQTWSQSWSPGGGWGGTPAPSTPQPKLPETGDLGPRAAPANSIANYSSWAKSTDRDPTSPWG